MTQLPTIPPYKAFLLKSFIPVKQTNYLKRKTTKILQVICTRISQIHQVNASLIIKTVGAHNWQKKSIHNVHLSISNNNKHDMILIPLFDFTMKLYFLV
ncbi:CLUMA_CG014735, isoform A [Clunio marinus]|uniref:CLUMA_CG014735, isoform A n=1 Tax=Clunio marinus TaxID=568069 RepID=A0A1J1ILF4_9DIPT|nr:CLUMA_CG014735, isoform A [Clunio marinus]